MQYKKFRSVNDDLRIASLTGHVMILGKEWRDVPEFLWADAYSLGAQAEDMKIESVSTFIEEKKQEAIEKEATERELIKTKMRQAYVEPVTFLDQKGKLIQRKIVALLGQPIKRDLMDEIWAEIVAEGEGK